MIHVIATIQIRSGQRAAFLTKFHDNVPNVLAEDGCIEYGPAVDLATGLSAQGPVREDAVVVVEKWRDLDALRAHLAAPHMATYREQVKDLVTSVQLQVLHPA